jgi:hypothetical protein
MLMLTTKETPMTMTMQIRSMRKKTTVNLKKAGWNELLLH